DSQTGHAVGQTAQRIDMEWDVRRLTRIVAIATGGRLECSSCVCGSSRHRPGVVNTLVRPEADSEVGDEAERRFQAIRATERSRNPNGAALVSTERNIDF